jgi:hypothetical protein
MTNNEAYTEKLKLDWATFVTSTKTLELSVNKCVNIIQKNEYTFEDEESFDSLTSKFARTSDFFLQKVIRGIWISLHEPSNIPLIDILNRAEKLEIIESSKLFLEIRELRNSIAHEYLTDSISDIVQLVIEKWPKFHKNIQKTEQFLKNRSIIHG